jgi:hypothetical protein
MVKLIIAVWQRKQLSCTESRLPRGETLATWIAVYFCRNDVRCGAAIKAARSNRMVSCNFLYRCHAGSAHPELSAAVKWPEITKPAK